MVSVVSCRLFCSPDVSGPEKSIQSSISITQYCAILELKPMPRAWSMVYACLVWLLAFTTQRMSLALSQPQWRRSLACSCFLPHRSGLALLGSVWSWSWTLLLGVQLRCLDPLVPVMRSPSLVKKSTWTKLERVASWSRSFFSFVYNYPRPRALMHRPLPSFLLY